MINTIQFNNKEYHRIAVKRDVEAVAQTRYGFFYSHWDVLIDGTLYLFAIPTGNTGGVFNLLGTNMTIPVEAIPNAAYEGMEVPVNIPNSELQTIGTLHLNSQYFNLGCSKSTAELYSICSLKYPSANYTADRLVREEDIIKHDTVKLYFDENYINVECFTQYDIQIESGVYDGYINRSVNDGLSVVVQRSKNSQSYITCHIGDTIKIISTNSSLKNVAVRSYTDLDDEYEHIGPVDENGNVNTISLQPDGSFDYIITLDCFITFDIATANYILYGSILEDTEYCDSCTVQVNNTDFIIAGSTELAKRPIQEHSTVNINTSLSIYTVEAHTKKRDAVFADEPEYILVDENNNPIYSTNGSEVYVDTDAYDGLSLLANSQGLIILSDSTSLPLDVQGWYNLIEVINLTTNTKETVTITSGGSHSSTSSAYFTMPSADCLLTVSIKIVTGGDTVTISPLYSLTIDVDENSSSVFPISITTGNTTTEYNSSTTIQNVENNYFSATWNKVDGKLYHILYKTNYTIFDDYATKATSYSNSLMGNRTLSIRLIDPDVIYRNTTKIPTIEAEKKYEENNIIISDNNTIMALNDYPRHTYYANTESSIKTSGNHFTNLQSLKKVVFNNADTTFTVNEDAFYECNKLESVSINGTENIKVKDRAFYNNIMLSEFNDLNKITELGQSCFYGVGLEEYTANTELRVIPKLAFSESLLSTADLSASSLTKIDSFAFDNCTKLSKVIIPQTLSTLGDQVFGENIFKAVHTVHEDQTYIDMKVNSDNSESLLFNADSEYKNGLTTLPRYTFEFCKLLEEVHLPASITHIEKGAFHECDNLKHFASPGLKTIELDAFYGTWIEKSYNYDSLPQKTNSLAYKDGTSGIYFYFPYEVSNPNRHVTLIKPDPDKDEYILYKRPITFPGAGFNCYFNRPIVAIADYGFSANDTVDFVNPYTVDFNAYSPLSKIKYIGNYAFKNCGADIIDLHWSKVSYLGKGAFYNCKALSRVIGFENAPITTILPYTFYNCGSNIHGIGATIDSFGSLSTNMDFFIPNTTTEIGAHAFENCRLLMGIANIETCKIHTIGDYAFRKCFRNTAWRTLEGLRIGGECLVIAICITATIISLGTGIAAWGEAVGTLTGEIAFDGFFVYESVAEGVWITFAGGGGCLVATLGASHHAMKSLPERVRKRLEHTSFFHTPYVTKLGENAFEDCTYLGVSTLNKNISEIPNNAYNNCKRLAVVSFADSEQLITSPEDKKLTPCGQPANLKRIGKNAFKNCNNLVDFTVQSLLSTVEEIDTAAFLSAKINSGKDKRKSQQFIVLSPNIKKLGNQSLHFQNKLYLFMPMIDLTELEVEGNPFNTNEVVLGIPKSAADKFKDKFSYLPEQSFLLIDDNDAIWSSIKASGYDLSWVANADNDVHFIDLGLPSGTLWSSKNLGATIPQNLGLGCAWATASPTMEDVDGDYLDSYKDREFTEEYDVATVVYGQGYRLPTAELFTELVEKCTWDWDVSERGYYITGDNGNSIFLPTEDPKIKGEINVTKYRTISRKNDIPQIFEICKATRSRTVMPNSEYKYAFYCRPVYNK